jgi:DNA (cytosine-5)-methyltransferase 1
MEICIAWSESMTGRVDCVDSTQNIISFCTGYGGLELGIRRAGVDVRTIVNVEIEAFCCANILAKTEEGRMDNAPIWTDLKTFPASEFRGKISGLCGGYPCQPFSSAGKRQGEKDPRHLWPYILKHVRAIRPVWCFFENVAGHTTMGLWRVLSDLEEEGYRCAWGIFSAEEVGAPHQRKRVFILGNSTSLRPRGGIENCEGEQSEVLGERLESDELAHPASARKHGELRDFKQEKSRNNEHDCNGETAWPARPGEEQYEWEEPRVTEAQSELVRAVDGTACGVDAIANRVDRLRLLGNGVVSQTAELAWKTLWKEMNK